MYHQVEPSRKIQDKLNWRDYVSWLTREHLGVPLDELKEVTWPVEAWTSILRALFPRSDSKSRRSVVAKKLLAGVLIHFNLKKDGQCQGTVRYAGPLRIHLPQAPILTDKDTSSDLWIGAAPQCRIASVRQYIQSLCKMSHVQGNSCAILVCSRQEHILCVLFSWREDSPTWSHLDGFHALTLTRHNWCVALAVQLEFCCSATPATRAGHSGSDRSHRQPVATIAADTETSTICCPFACPYGSVSFCSCYQIISRYLHCFLVYWP